ncbi:hypothetical protein WJX72_006658 [[Myrmecia] bisecta]|uniref:F-box domain-containing protein n=1 Tax=[Myrmecia] bisecta TaxID=41462 RepID=A0AAW1PJA5_9CHLO
MAAHTPAIPEELLDNILNRLWLPHRLWAQLVARQWRDAGNLTPTTHLQLRSRPMFMDEALLEHQRANARMPALLSGKNIPSLVLWVEGHAADINRLTLQGFDALTMEMDQFAGYDEDEFGAGFIIGDDDEEYDEASDVENNEGGFEGNPGGFGGLSQIPVQPLPSLPVDETNPDYFDYLRCENGMDPFPGLQLLRRGGVRRIFHLLSDGLRELHLLDSSDLWRHTGFGLGDSLTCLSAMTSLRRLSLGASVGLPEEEHHVGDMAIANPQCLDGIWVLTCLTSLHLSSYGIGHSPADVCLPQLTHLTKLNLNGCHLEEIPPFVSRMTTLPDLAVSENKFEEGEDDFLEDEDDHAGIWSHSRS